MHTQYSCQKYAEELTLNNDCITFVNTVQLCNINKCLKGSLTQVNGHFYTSCVKLSINLSPT